MESPFRYIGNSLYCDDVSLVDIARECGTPAYVYSADGIRKRYRAYDESFAGIPHRICFAVKACSNLAVLRLLAESGAGFDIVSGGELFRVLRAGGDPAKVVFSGVGKTAQEIDYALEQGIHSFNCESEPELEMLSTLAQRRGARARIAIRVNPDVDAATHPYISTGLQDHKFGIAIELAPEIYRRALSLPGLLVEGISCHIGSQMLDEAPLLEAIQKVLHLAGRLRNEGVPIRTLDLGGGLGVAYQDVHQTPDISQYVRGAAQLVSDGGFEITMEPGRSITAECGALVSQVLFRKITPKKEFLVIDAAMNDLIRPALYGAHHEIVPVERKADAPAVTADIVGPVCESGDFLAKNRQISALGSGDLVAVLTAGAYGFVAASNYNSRPRPPEVLVDNGSWRIVRSRETLEDLVRGETC